MDVYTLQPWGLYLARPTPGRDQFHYLESWLLPTLGLRATVFHWNPGHERDQDHYLDVCAITVGDAVWRTVDHYLDLVVHTGQRTELVDVDELLEAHHMGLVDRRYRGAGNPRRTHRRRGPGQPRSRSAGLAER